MSIRENPLFCPLCHNQPRLAGYGIDEDGRLFIHVMVYKGGFIKADVFIHGGTVTLRCYKCERYHTVRIRESRVQLVKSRRPDMQ